MRPVAAAARRRPGPCTSIPRKSSSGCACAIAAVVSPMPKPISSTRGARRPNARSKSSGESCQGKPKRGSSVSSARCCAGDMRPCRSTKLRTGRRCAIDVAAPDALGSEATSPAGTSRRHGSRHGGGKRIQSASEILTLITLAFCCPAGVYSIARVPSVLPRRRRVNPLLARAPGVRLVDAIFRHPPDHDLVRAALRAEVGGDEVLPVRRQDGIRGQVGTAAADTLQQHERRRRCLRSHRARRR